MEPNDALLLARSGVAYKAIAVMANAPIGTVGAWIHHARKKEGHVPRQKRLSADMVAHIFVRANRGDTLKEIHRDLEVPMGTIATVMRRLRQQGLLEYRRAGRDA